MVKKWRKSVCAVILTVVAMVNGQYVRAEEGGTLTLYMSDWQLEQFQPSIDLFQEQYPEVDLELEIYNMSSGFLAEAQKLATRLMAGEGPDLLISDNVPTGDLIKLIKTGVFAPLDEFMDREDCWNEEQYVMSVVNGGKFDGIQYVMPLTYLPLVMVSSEEAAQEAHMTEADCPEVLSLMKSVSALYDTDYSERILADGVQLSAFPLYLDGVFMDYREECITTDPEVLQEACEAYAGICQEDSSFIGAGYDEYGTAITERRAYCYFPVYASIDAVMQSSSAVASAETPYVLPIRSLQGETLASIQTYAGIRANSKNKEAAWNLLRIIVSEEAQMAHANSNRKYPVSKGALEQLFKESAEQAEHDNGVSLDAAFLENFRQLCEPDRCVFISNVVADTFKQMMEPFYYGEASYEECMKEFESFARIYLTE